MSAVPLIATELRLAAVRRLVPLADSCTAARRALLGQRKQIAVGVAEPSNLRTGGGHPYAKLILLKKRIGLELYAFGTERAHLIGNRGD